jgi:hypothetical protein
MPTRTCYVYIHNNSYNSYNNNIYTKYYSLTTIRWNAGNTVKQFISSSTEEEYYNVSTHNWIDLRQLPSLSRTKHDIRSNRGITNYKNTKCLISKSMVESELWLVVVEMILITGLIVYTWVVLGILPLNRFFLGYWIKELVKYDFPKIVN